MVRPSFSKPEVVGRAKKSPGGRNCHRKHVEDGTIEDDRPKGSEKSQPHCVLHGKYELGRLLGHGTFAKVYHARHLVTGKSVAMKVVGKEKVTKVGMTEQVKREISVMKMVQHPNIVELHEVMASKTKIYFAMELVRGGELFSKVAMGRLREDAARNYFQQLISAVDFCHSRGVYHRDLKPENLLLDDDGNLKGDRFRSLGVCRPPEAGRAPPHHLRDAGVRGAGAGFLPFQDDNIVSLYRKIYRGDFKCPPWFSPESRRLITKLLDPNPSTRITAAKIMESSFFRKTIPRSVSRAKDEESVTMEEKPKTETLNAFHIISLSEGFDLSPLFKEKRREEKEELRFATAGPASSVISRLEEVAARAAGKFSVRRSGDTSVRLQGEENGRKGKLAIAADIFALTPSFLVVEVKKSSGDTLEYNQFCSEELRPALKDIVWTSPVTQNSTPA
ncbi:SOS3-interacting protein 3 [Actinidia rufa]|uniref:non-specific serine/threonine protein kinase n=1 Tax=Actinidia rufa TaxID=165716 RepID=A0A7J0DV15_9ERIC|nr:SOS3-interacting protein 3 [Actinidia rufa]